MIRLCFVCAGNICRSPTGEGVMRVLVAESGLADAITVESAGTGGWHAGDPPDRRSAAEARQRGITLAGSARQFRGSDFRRFDYVLALDAENASHLRRIAPDTAAGARVHLLREFDPAGPDPVEGLDVPDPYYGGAEGFARVFDVIDAACRGLLVHLTEAVPAPQP